MSKAFCAFSCPKPPKNLVCYRRLRHPVQAAGSIVRYARVLSASVRSSRGTHLADSGLHLRGGLGGAEDGDHQDCQRNGAEHESHGTRVVLGYDANRTFTNLLFFRVGKNGTGFAIGKVNISARRGKKNPGALLRRDGARAGLASGVLGVARRRQVSRPPSACSSVSWASPTFVCCTRATLRRQSFEWIGRAGLRTPLVSTCPACPPFASGRQDTYCPDLGGTGPFQRALSFPAGVRLPC